MNRNLYQKYQQSSVQTATPAQLLIMLYDGAIRFVKLGIEAIEQKNYQKANLNLLKSQAIIHELIAGLDHDYAISKNLLQIYEYMLYQLIQSNLKKNTKPAEEVLSYLKDMKETWMEASKQVTMRQGATHA